MYDEACQLSIQAPIKAVSVRRLGSSIAVFIACAVVNAAEGLIPRILPVASHLWPVHTLLSLSLSHDAKQVEGGKLSALDHKHRLFRP